MTLKLVCCYGLLLLAATATLAQPRPPKRPRRRPTGVPTHVQPLPEQPRAQREEEAFIRNCYEMPLLNAQPEPVDPNRVYTYVEQMPALNGQSSLASLTAAIQQRLVLPLAAPLGHTFVRFVVSKKGVVTEPQIVKGLQADVDSAVVVATRKLPRFTPGKQQGQVVAVSYTLAIPIGAPVVTRPAEARGKD